MSILQSLAYPASDEYDAGPHASVDAPARLHLGFLDPSGSLGRRYGSVGLVIDGVCTRLRAAFAASDTIVAVDEAGKSSIDRVRGYVQALRAASGLDAALAYTIEETPPRHAGFGSGTQLALATGHAFATLHQIRLDTATLASMLDRGARSGVGVAGFDRGGLVVDGGPGADGGIAPMLARLEFPGAWRVVLALDEGAEGLHGQAEVEAIARLPAFAAEQSASICHRVLMQLLPAVAECDFARFAHALTSIQRSIGMYFAPAQRGSMYTSPGVTRLLEWIAQHHLTGVGQSSWGPTGFAFLPSQADAEAVIAGARAAEVVDAGLRLMIVRGRNKGATIAGPSRAAQRRRVGAT